MQIHESTIENLAIETLKTLGWQYADGRAVLEGLAYPWRKSKQEVVLKPLLLEALKRINPHLPATVLEDVVEEVCKNDISSLEERNQKFYQLLKQGVPVQYQQDNEKEYSTALLVDFEQVNNNSFHVINQFRIEGNQAKRPDILCFVNGLPLVIFELKHPFKEVADLESAFNQLQTYKNEIENLFVFNQIMVISDGTRAKVGSLTANLQRFLPWHIVDESQNSQRIKFEYEIDSLLKGLFEPQTLLDYVRNFVMFETKGSRQKKIAAYHQFYGVNAAVKATIHAQERHSCKIGVMWHTQGSGKSLSMLFYVGKLISQPELKNPTIVVVTDRNDLDDQLFATFCQDKDILHEQVPIQVKTRNDLRSELAKRECGGIIFSTIQKFSLNETEEQFPELNCRDNIIVISDEAHRSQYISPPELSEQGKYRYGYAKYLRTALPNALFIGFTGTPISTEDKDTQEVFGKYISIYDIQDAVNDGATVPIFYEPRQVLLKESEDFKQVVEDGQALLDENSDDSMCDEALRGSDVRIKALAKDLVQHFIKRNDLVKNDTLVQSKAMVVAMSRKICVKIYDEIVELNPDWHSKDINQGKIKVIMTTQSSDYQEMQAHAYSESERKTLEKRFKDPDDPLQIVIVCDMWLTGFEAPVCNTMYIDKPMQGHNLMQAIARVNRVFPNKSRENGGLVVDYAGLKNKLHAATQEYTNDGGSGEVFNNLETAFQKILEHVEIIHRQFATPVKGNIFDLHHALQEQDPKKLIAAALEAANHIVALDHFNQEDKTPRKQAFLNAVSTAKKGMTLCYAIPEAQSYAKEIAFFAYVRATILKNENQQASPNSPKARQVQIDYLINQAVQSDGVVDLLTLAGEEHPNIAILSDEFLEIIKNDKYQELWASRLEAYLKQEIRNKASHNITLKKTFEEKLKDALNKYNENHLIAFEFCQELQDITKAFNKQLDTGRELGLNPKELAFYSALDSNQIDDQARLELTKEIVNTLNKSTHLDWRLRENVKADMRLLLKGCLRDYDYPEDEILRTIESIMNQAEALDMS